MYKLIAIDMDGTLLNDQHQVSEENKATLAEAKRRGIKIVLCSGRPIVGMRAYLAELGLTGPEDYAIAYNGALTESTEKQKEISRLSLNYDQLKQLYELSLELDVPMHFYDTKKLYTPNKNISEFTIAEAFLSDTRLHYREFSEMSPDASYPKVLFIDEPEKLTKVIEKLPKELYEQFTVVQSAPFFLEFVHKMTSKGIAVRKLAESLGIKQEEVMAIGDNDNDMAMIEYAGCGVAMANAIPALKAAADFETLTNNEDGVAHAIETIALK